MRLFGYAGTGKTTIAKAIAQDVKGTVLFGTFTGKASLVMRKKGCDNANTLHSLAYRVDDENSVGGKPAFTLNQDSAIRYSRLLIIDEASMVGPDIGADIMSFGTKVLVLGDPAQLQPVNGEGYFTSVTPDIMLEEVHRTAADSPIIRLSMDIRNGKRLQYGSYGDSAIIKRNQLGQRRVLESDIVICGMNQTRRTLNMRIRELNGITDKFPVAGEQLICLKNDREIGMYNGGIWKAEVAAPPDRNGLILMKVTTDDDPTIDYPVDVIVPEEFFLGTEKELHWTALTGVQQMYFGRAITCHKAQGSEWDNVTIFDEAAIFKTDAWRWRYTAITRAAEKFTLIM
ncbi:DNA helicase [Yersinia phage fHe-Yen8-01]|nr:DNA helicase [Yersinia phage fHe-Yen8-01]